MQLEDIVPEPAQRSFIVAKTRSGKSTLGCVILTMYHNLYQADRIFIMDPKRRYFPTGRPRHVSERIIFPDGFTSRVQRFRRQWRRGVRIYGKLIDPHMGFGFEDRVMVVQDPRKILELLRHLYQHPDARRGVLVFLDESFDLSRAGRAQDDLKRLIQQGGEISVGLLIINQRPRDIPRIFLTESENLYIGRLIHPEDRTYLMKQTDVPAEIFARPLPSYWWVLAKQQEEAWFKFTLNMEG